MRTDIAIASATYRSQAPAGPVSDHRFTCAS